MIAASDRYVPDRWLTRRIADKSPPQAAQKRGARTSIRSLRNEWGGSYDPPHRLFHVSGQRSEILRCDGAGGYPHRVCLARDPHLREITARASRPPRSRRDAEVRPPRAPSRVLACWGTERFGHRHRNKRRVTFLAQTGRFRSRRWYPLRLDCFAAWHSPLRPL